MAARISRSELKVGIQFLSRVHNDVERFAMLSGHAAAIGIEHKVAVDQVAMILQQPINAVRCAAFFVCRKGENDVAIGLKPSLLQADESGHRNGVAVFHVLRASSIEIAVLLDKLKRIRGPVLTAGFDDIQMSNGQDRLGHLRRFHGAVQRDSLYVRWGRERSHHAQEIRRQAAAFPWHWRRRGIPDGVRRVDLNQLLKDVA